MEIGQKVRFLNEVGGGVIAGFQGKDIVLIEDSDGFEIPMLRSQVVAIETNANNFERPNPGINTPSGQSHGRPAHKANSILADDSPTLEQSPATRGHSLMGGGGAAHERKGGDLLNVMLAFVPQNSRELTDTSFEAYLVNDSNYFISVFIAAAENAAWHLCWQGTVEPNTKVLVETFDRLQLNDMEHLAVNVIAWKEDKPFMLKEPVGMELRLDLVKFYKLHVFQDSPFFREPALIYEVVNENRMLSPDSSPINDPASIPEEPLPLTTGVGLDDEPSLSHLPTGEGLGDGPSLSSLSHREALKAAKRALKAEQNAELARKYASMHADAGKDNVVEVDLHISALLDNTAGLSDSVLLNTQLTEFRIVLERYKAKHGQRIVFIHGKGEGKLRDAIVKELQHRYRSYTYQDASFREYGYGAIMVTIK